jgi:hypothetical protein
MSSDDTYLYDLALLSTIQMLIFFLIKYILSVHMSSHKQNKCNLHGTRKYNTLDNLFSMCKEKVKGGLVFTYQWISRITWPRINGYNNSLAT